ncbi:type IV pilus assembly protein FimV [Sulfuricella denitrificans]|uniref:type IV pilus assembly protein FimV n=1 Tax=Sulfuricella denitrificans TaxID=649841 RepID=UPI0011D1CC73|nr:hypothetical protein [Sulfuricella denitrificans]
MGEHFSGRIPVISTTGESVEPSCFKLVNESHKQDGIPLVDSARLTVAGGSGKTYLQVSSRKRINDLAVRLLVKAGCESEVIREYTILLNLPDNVITTRPDQAVISAPLVEPDLSPPQPVLSASQRDRRAGGMVWEITAGESLASIAANIYPNSRRMQRRFSRHAMAANPEVFADKNPDMLLSAGTVLYFPDLRELARQPAEKKAGQGLAAESAAQPDTKPDVKPDKPPVSRKTSKAKKLGAESEVRLKLTTGDLDISASGKITEGEREILREKQRILMDIDDMAANNLSLNHRLKQMEEHILGLQTKLEGLERQRSEMASNRPAVPAPHSEPRQEIWEWPAYTAIIALSAGGLGLLMVAYLKRKRKKAEAEALMELDVDLGSVWEVDPDAKKSGSSASLSNSANAGVQMGKAIAPVDVLEIDGQPSSSDVPKAQYGVSDTGFEIALDSIESAVEEADIYLALGEKDRAIANLKYQIDSHPRSTADLWFKLMEIYHDFDMRPEFEALVTEFRRYFNIAKPNWETMASGEISSRSIAEFPRLMGKISSTWGSAACLEYLHHLLLDNKGGLREGFELGIASDILLLIHLLEGMLGKLPAGEVPSEENRALEFTFEPSVQVEPEKNDFSSHTIEVSDPTVAELGPLLELEIVPPVVKNFPELNQEDAGQAVLLEAEKRAFSLDLGTAGEPEKSHHDLPKLEWDNLPVVESVSVLARPDPRSALERRHPRIVENITLIWGGLEIVSYLKSLVVDSRGDREGFDKEVLSELMMLSTIAVVDEGVTDIWSSSGESKLAAQEALKPRKAD